MKRAFAGISVAALLSITVLGQSAGTTPAFELADVHLRAHTSNPTPFMTGGILRGGRYDLRNATMLDMIRLAYGVTDPDTILGGPNWLERDRFDVVAKAPEQTPPDTVRLMLQALLADRFKLVLHKDTKPIQGFALTAGRGKPKIKEASGQGQSGCQPQPQTPQPGTVPYAVVSCRSVTMETFA
jgi:uncharacterized protein (TIGR03435 family)